MVGMDGLCVKQSTNYGIGTAYKGLGQAGIYPDVSSIITTVTFSGNASACPAQGPTQSPHAPLVTSLVTECWQGAPSSMYVALDLMCQQGNASFNQVGWASVPMFACLSVCLSAHLPTNPHDCLFVCLFVCLSVCLS
jgi:hypothetical protein